MSPTRSVVGPDGIRREPQQAILEATVAIVRENGMAGVSHRVVAARAGVSLGAIRYYYSDREHLLLACLEHLQAQRREHADLLIRRWESASTRPAPEELADALIEATHGPALDDASLRASVGWTVDAARESPALAERLAEGRGTLDAQIRTLLDLGGYPDLAEYVVSTLLDGCVITVLAEGGSDTLALFRRVMNSLLRVSATI